MSYEPLDDEPTIVKPTPGGVERKTTRPAPAAMAPAPVQAPSFDFALLANSSFNVVVGAAAQLLNLARRLRGSLNNRDVAVLRARAVEEIKSFERVIMASGTPPEQARAAHYALCATLDDIVLNTPWGAYSSWASNSLVSTFHVDVTGGERFFDLLTHLHKDPGTNRDVLALMYLCLSVGFEGRLRVIDQGALELSRIRESLYRTLRQVYGDFERELSPHWRGIEARHRPLRSSTALWTILAVAVALLIAAFVLFTTLINGDSDRTLQALTDAPPHGRATLAVVAPAPLPKPDAGVADSVRKALQGPIDKGQVEVVADGQTLMVRIHNAGMFASGSAVVQDKFKPVIAQITHALAGQSGPIAVLGHTDNQPIHTLRFPSNWELSLARATAVSDLLRDALPGGNIKPSGRSDNEPLASNGTAAGREQNRRVEVVLHSPVQPAGEAGSGALP